MYNIKAGEGEVDMYIVRYAATPLRSGVGIYAARTAVNREQA